MPPPQGSPTSAEEVAKVLLSKCGQGYELISARTIQSLWAGYGHISEIRASQNCQPGPSFILKHIKPPNEQQNGHMPDEGHIRKILSYQVEQYFYTELASQMPAEINVAKCVASSESGLSNATALLLTDLRQAFPIPGEKRAELSEKQTYAALDWLADFHGFWSSRAKRFDKKSLVKPPLEHFTTEGSTSLKQKGVWLNGGYTYLPTRRSEYNVLKNDKDSEWSPALTRGSPSNAEKAASALSPELASNDDYVTLLHGDVKSENLFSSKDESAVAFYDFQYVGLGLGVCDLAKLFTCSVPKELLPPSKIMEAGEQLLLKHYHTRLRKRSGKPYAWETFKRHWEMALLDWLRFQASWGFWGNTNWLEERCRGVLEQRHGDVDIMSSVR